MASSNEQIEAKLCAFVEGELDEAGRAEIEKHLAANPQHRALIEELSRVRSTLRALPKQPAPVDMSEVVQGSIERNALLDGIEEEEQASSMRIHRWPAMRATAAVLLLAAGLGFGIFKLLPSGREVAPEVALLKKSSDANSSTGRRLPDAPVRLATPGERESRARDEGFGGGAGGGGGARSGAGPDAPAPGTAGPRADGVDVPSPAIVAPNRANLKPDVVADHVAGELSKAVEVPQAAVPTLSAQPQTPLASAPDFVLTRSGAGEDAVITSVGTEPAIEMRIVSVDTRQSADEIAQYLRVNNIAYNEISASVPTIADADKLELASKSAAEQRAKDAAVVADADAKKALADAAVDSPSKEKSAAPTQEAGVKDTGSKDAGAKDPGAAPTTEPVVVAGLREGLDQVRGAVPGVVSGAAKLVAGQSGERLVVARGLTRQQAGAIRQAIEMRENQRQLPSNELRLNNGPTTEPVTNTPVFDGSRARSGMQQTTDSQLQGNRGGYNQNSSQSQGGGFNGLAPNMNASNTGNINGQLSGDEKVSLVFVVRPQTIFEPATRPSGVVPAYGDLLAPPTTLPATGPATAPVEGITPEAAPATLPTTAPAG